MRVVRFLQVVSVLGLLPFVVAHEATHALAARPWATNASVSVFPPRARISFENPSRAVLSFVGLAPTIVGYLTVALLGVFVLVLGVVPSTSSFVADVYFALGWIVYATPSRGDLRQLTTAEAPSV